MTQKAQARPIHQAYLILSNKKVEFTDRLNLVDLFFPDTLLKMGDRLTAEQYKVTLARLLWQTLTEKGFRLNGSLEEQYKKQLSCIWCGGTVMTYGGEDASGYEVRCSDCGYIYEES